MSKNSKAAVKETQITDVVYMSVNDLTEAVYNPRKISMKELSDLRNSIEKFGITEPIIVNKTKDRGNIIISGHQRVKACRQLGILDVPCHIVELSEEDEKELNIRMNKAGGEFDFKMLDAYFDRDSLLDFGFLASEFEKLDDDVDGTVFGKEPVYPLVPELSEKYDYVVILTKNEVDTAYMINLFNLHQQASYKNSRVGVGRVVSFDDFMAVFNKKKDEKNG